MTRTLTTALVGMGLMAMPAMAGGFNFGLGINTGGTRVGVGVNVNEHTGVGVGVDVGPAAFAAPVAVQPVVVAPVQRVWVPAVNQVVTERIWVPNVQTLYRDVPVTDVFGNVISYRREAYTVDNGCWQNVQRQVVVQEGYWRNARAVPGRVYPTARSRGVPIAAVRRGF